MPYTYVLARVDSNNPPQDYVFARIYTVGYLSYEADIGYCVGGHANETLWAGNIPLGWSTSLTFLAGLPGYPREYQLYAGTTLVKDYQESGTSSVIASDHRLWGSLSNMANGGFFGVFGPSTIAGFAVSDNLPPTLVGSTFRRFRASGTATAGLAGGGNTLASLTSDFFDTPQFITPDYSYTASTHVLTVAKAGTYIVSLCYGASVGGISGMGVAPSLYHTPAGGSATLFRLGTQAAVQSGFSGSFGYTWVVYLGAGDSIAPGYYNYGGSASMTLMGESTGSAAFFEVGLANWSTS